MARAAEERAALVALLRHSRSSLSELLRQLAGTDSVTALLERALTAEGEQLTLTPPDPVAALQAAQAAIEDWQRRGIELRTLLDADYPENLRLVHDRPPLLFIRGRLQPRDARSIAIIGTRHASAAGLEAGAAFAERLGEAGLTVVSGLAAGIDTAVHQAALTARVRTLAVIGTGLDHAYPPQNAQLQDRVAREGAVISTFSPETPPSPEGFRRRNAIMSGLTRGIVVIEGSMRSGTRLATRLALAQARPVFLWRGLRGENWARELAERPGTRFVEDPDEVAHALERLEPDGGLDA